MSLILQGIDMPEENQMIQLEIYPDGTCSGAEFINGECHEFTYDTMPKCFQIPKNHGNLIDGQLLFKLLQCQDILQKHDGKWESMFPIILGAER